VLRRGDAAGGAKGRSSKEFHASHCGQRPSHRGDSKPHAPQKKTERVFGIAFFLCYFVAERLGWDARLHESAHGMHQRSLEVAIDGPAASGKTTVARRLAQRLGVLYLDTGAMYRALALLALQTQTDADNGAALRRLLETGAVRVELDAGAPRGFRVYAGGAELDDAALQSNAVNAIVSTVAAHAAVRDAMVAQQRAIAARGPVVMAGRDIGTVVLPGAPVKIFLTASVDARVSRRRDQLALAGVDVAAHRLKEEIEERDRLDATRPVAPLVAAADAHVVDSSALTADEVVDAIQKIVERVRAGS
jgi:cytidylate kinase